MFAAANRDPRILGRSDELIDRDTRRSLGWGYGVHGCVGRMLAMIEAKALLGAIVAQVERFEPAGPDEPWMTTSATARSASRSCSSSLEVTMPAPVTRIDAIRYARHERNAADNFTRPVDDHDLPMPLDYYVWAIHREEGPPVIVDTGFGEHPRRWRAGGSSPAR